MTPLTHGATTLIDDESHPSLRQHIGHLLAQCTHADIAVGHIRLAAIDLADAETRAIQHMRILLGRLEVRALNDTSASDTPRLRTLHSLLDSGRVEIRNAGIGAWSPDFSVWRLPDATTCLIGPHWFREPVALDGPSFTLMTSHSDTTDRVRARFEALWLRSHDVLDPVISAITRHEPYAG